MSLKTYQEKRKFDKTPEPSGKTKATKAGKARSSSSKNEAAMKNVLRFVVQKHDASHLHYDFRLEIDGVMKSWAIPKGPSLNPKDKRLAMAVEDHPLEYRHFEGVIPEGNYGAGTVMIWDEGFYAVDPSLSKKENEKLFLKGIAAGDLKFVMLGEKLKGSFALVKMKREDNQWLLIKHRDEYATEADIREESHSVVSQRTLGQILKDEGLPNGNKWISQNKKGKANSKLAKLKSKSDLVLDKTLKAPMPRKIKPMLTTLVDEPFTEDGWLFELKLDGYRAIAEIEKDSVALYSRNFLSFKEKFSAITNELKTLTDNLVLDGEVVALDDDGKPSFALIQDAVNQQERLVYYVFDLLYINGYDIRSLPLRQRKKLLKQVLPTDSSCIRYCDHVEANGDDLFKKVQSQSLEGIVAKSAESPYQAGVRGQTWLKIKTHLRQEAVICGFTEPRKSREHLGALILGVYDNKKLRYIGHTGTGMNHDTLQLLFDKLSLLEVSKCPFEKTPKTNEAATWVKPKLVCEVKFSEWTQDKQMRHPVFLGLRPDKKALDVVFEKEQDTDMAVKTPAKKKLSKKSLSPNQSEMLSTMSKTNVKTKKPDLKGSKIKPPVAEKKSTFSKQAPGQQDALTIEVNRHQVTITHPKKLYWKDKAYTKQDLVAYYQEVAPYILPYLKDRPYVMNRFPNGIETNSFYQKDQPQKLPEWVETIDIYSESTDDTIQYLMCQNEETLLYLANLGCIEMNPWNSRQQNLENPDWMVIDLDPEDIGFDKVIEAAKVTHQVLNDIGARNYCKTSGKTGLHIYVPLAAKYDYEIVRQFGQVIAEKVNQELPETTSIERSPKKRQKRVYLDYLQNRYGQTLVSPYSVRPTVSASVSTPLHWEEVKKGLKPETFTIRNLSKRLKVEGDLWKLVLGRGLDLKECLGRLT